MARRHMWAWAVVAVASAVAAGCSSGGSGPRSDTRDTRDIRDTRETRGPGDRSRAAADDDVRLNQIQVIGSHNSYHLLPTAAERKLRGQLNPSGEPGLEYRHAPLVDQLQSQKVRQVELDVWLDSKGGRFATPVLQTATKGPPSDPVMRQPGIKVFHIQDTDYHSSCLTLQICLRQIKGWSDAHPAHVPVAVLVELKDSPVVFGSIRFATPEPWTVPAMDTLDAEIRTVFPPSALITPDDVRGSHPTLVDAVRHGGWPTLGRSRGKFVFLMDNAKKRTAYLQGHPDLAGRVLFTNSVPGQPDAAFLERNDAKQSAAEIRSLVQQGYVVRTMADLETHEARADDPSSREAALASGAQWVSTDYPVSNYGAGFATRYVVRLPGGTVARCDPIDAPPRCTSRDLDTIWSAPVASPTTSRP